MKRYRIIIDFADGNRIDAKVVGRNEKDALGRLKSQPQYADFAKSDIIAELVEPIPIEPIDNERFAVTTIDNKPGWYVVADLDNLLKVEFKKGMYNETQRVLPIGNGKELSAIDGATAMREIGEFMFNNFNELI